MTGTFDDPNREAVGLPPIWTETAPVTAAKSEPEPKAKTTAKKSKSEDDGND